jgi:hypothetical protein
MRKGPRQGDVLLVPVETVRGQQIKPIKKRYTVAEGEMTGHHHSIPAGKDVAAFLGRDGMFVRSDEPMLHQEHDASILDGGDYEVVLQRRASDHWVRPSVD